jgi:hypothetical protein
MSAQPAPERKFYTPEERASFRAWRFGSTLDWCSLLLTEINYPVELRWFVDGVQGLCKGKEMRIAHSTLARRAQRFKNKAQASELTRRAIEANIEWARARRCMVFDIERPKPGEMEGKEKRARTRYTDYLTPAVVWAQEMERVAKKADAATWKKNTKYRLAKRREIMDEALKMLPGFERAEDMPESGAPDEKAPLSLSEYVQQREKILLAENRRVLDRLCEGDLVSTDDIDARLATLEIFHEKAVHELEKSFQSARDVLLGLKKTRLARALNYTDTEEVMAEFDEKVAEGSIDARNFLNETLQELAQTHSDDAQKAQKKGNAGDTLVDDVPEAESDARCIPMDEYQDGNTNTKGNAGDTLSGSPAERPEDDFEEFTTADTAAPVASLSQVDCALSYAGLGKPVFPTNPDKKPYTQHGFKDATLDAAQIRAWWRKWPDAGIGIPTGKASGWLVFDVDIDKGGDASLTALVEQHGDLPPTQQAATPSGGSHFVFNNPAHVEIRNSESKIGKGLDIRGEGGYMVAPGCHASRRWVNASDPLDMPTWLIEAATSEKHEPVNTDWKLTHYSFSGGRYFEDGERNKGLRDVACGRWLYGYAEDEYDLYQQLRDVRDTRCAPGKDSPATDDDLLNLARRTARKYPRGAKQSEVASA